MSRAIYAGSFDPITNGHMWTIQEGSKLFRGEGIVIVVAENAAKSPMFPLEERLDLVRKVVAGMDALPVDTRVVALSGKLLVDYAKEVGAEYLLRAARNGADFADEQLQRNMNGLWSQERLQTVLLMAPKPLVEVSSSFVRSLVGLQNWQPRVKELVPSVVYQALVERELQKRFVQMAQLTDAPELFEWLRGRYSSEGRHYHTLMHLDRCFRFLDEMKRADPARLHAVNWRAIEIALWYHDAFQGTDPDMPAGTTPERASCTHGLHAHFRGYPQATEQLILATDHLGRVLPGEDILVDIMLDIDLGILGTPPAEFDEYERQIRAEYAAVPDEVFREKRIQILQRFLDRDRIYRTGFMRERYEDQAHKNLIRSIALLCGASPTT